MEDMKSVYFIGIGGIGMSALARYFNDQGSTVYGYDRTETPLTKTLVSEGMIIQYNEDLSALPETVDMVVYTPAIPERNQIMQYYNSTSIPMFKRAQALGMIVNQGNCYAVAGSHGKSTTSAMLEHVMQVSEKNCTGFLGAISTNYHSNYVAGCSDCFVVEADEFDRSFHQIKPTATIVTSVDSDHLDIYGDLAGVQKGFLTYLNNVREQGKIIIQKDQSIIDQLPKEKVITYGIDGPADYLAENIRLEKGRYHFDVRSKTTSIEDIQLNMGGLYNVENALAVCALSLEVGVEIKSIKKAFESFKGLKRRYEKIIDTPQLVLIDDYAHHPEEIRSFIEGLKVSYPNQRIGVIFQPHLYSRTKDYYDHFAQSLDLADDVIIMDIYPAREEAIPGVTSDLIEQNMHHAHVQRANFDTVVQKAIQLHDQVIAVVGAGNIAQIVEPLKEKLLHRE